MSESNDYTFPPVPKTRTPLYVGLAAAALAVGMVDLFAWPPLSLWFLFGVGIQGFAPAYAFAGLRAEAALRCRIHAEVAASHPPAWPGSVPDWRQMISNRMNVYIAGSGLAGLAGLGMLYSFKLSPIPERRELLGDTMPLLIGVLSLIICGMFAFRLIRDWDVTFMLIQSKRPLEDRS